VNCPSRLTPSATLLLWGLLAASCGSRSEPVEPPPQPTSYRLIDHTDAAAVVDSPLVGLGSRLVWVEDRWDGAELEPVSSARGLSCWRVQPSARPVLLDADDLSVRVGGRAVEPGTVQYVEPEYSFATRAAEGEGDPSGFKDIVERGEVDWQLDLPAGSVDLELAVTNEDQRHHHYRLEVLLDGAVVGEVRGSRDQRVLLAVDVERGPHQLTLRAPQWSQDAAVYVPRVRVTVQARVGWFTLCADTTPAGIEASYPADPDDRGLAPLAALRPRDGLLDAGVGPDPYHMKKKLDLGVVSRNVLLAPTPTELRYEVDVPQNGRLRLGYGHTHDVGSGAAGAVFEVRLDGEHGSDQLMAQQLPPDGTGTVERTLDLSAYGGQRCVLRLLTRDGHHGADSGRCLSTCWYDPVLYAAPEAGAARPVNVIVISLDTLRADHLGCYGYGADTSPHLDALAEDGVLFERAYSQYPTTAISHVSMLTSRYPHRSARALLAEYGAARPEDVLGETTLAEHLRQRGWFTGAITGGGVLHPMFGFSAGFDFYEARDVDDSPEVLAERATTWLEDNADKPFFLFLHTYQIHSPYAPPEPHRGALWSGGETSMDPIGLLRSRGEGLCLPLPDDERRAMEGLYDGEIRFTDEALIGPLVARLRELQLYDDTLLIVTSDHGEEFGEHGCWSHGANVHRQVMHVPLVVKFPRGRHAGRRVGEVVELVDLVPTVLDVVGVEYDGQGLAGESLADVLERREQAGEAFGVKLATEPRDGGTHVVIADLFLVQGEDRLIVVERLPDDAPPDAGVMLFDLGEDPVEQHNVAADHGERRDELLERVRAYYEPGASLGEEGITEFGQGGDAWKRHLQVLGYVE